LEVAICISTDGRFCEGKIGWQTRKWCFKIRSQYPQAVADPGATQENEVNADLLEFLET